MEKIMFLRILVNIEGSPYVVTVIICKYVYLTKYATYKYTGHKDILSYVTSWVRCLPAPPPLPP